MLASLQVSAGPSGAWCQRDALGDLAARSQERAISAHPIPQAQKVLVREAGAELCHGKCISLISKKGAHYFSSIS